MLTLKRLFYIIVVIYLLFNSFGALSQKKLLTEAELKEKKVFRSLSEAFFNKKQVCILNLDSKELTQLPSKIRKLKNLQELYVRNNKLTSLPKELFQLKNLQKLMLGENHLIMIPAEIGNLANLEELDLFSKRPQGRMISLISGMVSLIICFGVLALAKSFGVISLTLISAHINASLVF